MSIDFFIRKHVAKDWVTKNNELLIKAGFICPLTAGIYTFLPLGLKTLDKITNLCRREMYKIGCMEIKMPCIAPISLLETSGREEKFGNNIFKFNGRNKRQLYLAPTHEEVVINICKRYASSYKALPIHLLQFQTKFRDELRVKGGIIRSKELFMQDSYSFHITQECLDHTYEMTRNAYKNIFTNLQLDFVIANADSADMLGNKSEEFHVLSDIGEDEIFISSNGYVANREAAEHMTQHIDHSNMSCVPLKMISMEDTVFDKHVCATVFKNIQNNKVITCLVKSIHTINFSKLHSLFVNEELVILHDHDPINSDITIIDYSVAQLDYFYLKRHESFLLGNCKNFNNYILKDIRYTTIDDTAPDGGAFIVKRGVEVGHIFDLGDQYSKQFNFKLADAKSVQKHILMGCYGIGISRLLGVCVEQHSTSNRLCLPKQISPVLVGVTYTNKCGTKEKDLAVYITNTLKDECNIEAELFTKTQLAKNLALMSLLGCCCEIIVTYDQEINQEKIKLQYQQHEAVFNKDQIEDLTNTIKQFLLY